MDARSTQLAALAFIIQCALMFAVVVFDQSGLRWLGATFAVCFWVLPFVGYIVALYRAPIFGRWSPVLKILCLAGGSLIVTVVGGFSLFLCMLLLGIPISPH